MGEAAIAVLARRREKPKRIERGIMELPSTKRLKVYSTKYICGQDLE